MPANDPQGTRGLLIDLFLLMKTVATHGVDHPLTAKSANLVVESTRKATPPVELFCMAKTSTSIGAAIAGTEAASPSAVTIAAAVLRKRSCIFDPCRRVSPDLVQSKD